MMSIFAYEKFHAYFFWQTTICTKSIISNQESTIFGVSCTNNDQYAQQLWFQSASHAPDRCSTILTATLEHIYLDIHIFYSFNDRSASVIVNAERLCEEPVDCHRQSNVTAHPVTHAIAITHMHSVCSTSPHISLSHMAHSLSVHVSSVAIWWDVKEK